MNNRYKITQDGDWPAIHHVLIQFINNCYNLSSNFNQHKLYPYFELKGKNIGFNKQLSNLDNIWDYYFDQQPPQNGNFNAIHKGGGHCLLSNINPNLIKEYSKIDKKYFKYKKDITKIVNNFKKTHLSKKSIGVHFRASDTLFDNSRPNVPLKIYKESILKVLDKYDTIFLSTDSQESLDYFNFHFKDKLVYKDHYRVPYTKTFYSIHKNPPHPYQQGLEVIIDSLLLSECDLIIKPESNLSAYSVIRKGGGDVHQIDIPLVDPNYHVMYFNNDLNILKKHYYIKDLEPSNINDFIIESKKFEIQKQNFLKNNDIESYFSLLKKYLFN
jgi:hypothetical protein